MKRPPTKYAHSGDAMIAYQVMGEGPIDLIVNGGPATHLDLQWEEPLTARTFERYASFSRLIRFDRRGTGLSDPVDSPPTLEQQMDDMRAVMDAIGIERVALLGGTDAGLTAMYAATHPEEVTSLVLAGVATSAAPYLTPERIDELLDIIENSWGEGRLLPMFAPSRVGDRQFEEWWARYERGSVTPSMARKLIELNLHVDLRGVLPAIQAPTLVIHRTDNPLIPVELGREAADLIPNARFVEFPGTDAYGWHDPDGAANDAIEEFLTGRRLARPSERVLATVLFTDICASTDRAAEVGDRAWRDLLDQHNAVVRGQLERWRGREIKTMGDGFVATFDGPARAVRCAHGIIEALRGLDLEVRAGLHTGEVEILDADVGGIAVHIGARVNALAGPGEVLVSSTVKELVVGSDLRFLDKGPHDLRGVPGEWRLFALEPTSPGAMAYAATPA
jgi:class 3 adenylate cyclase